MESHKRGAVAEGYYGDLILVSGDPLSDAGVLADPDNIVAVLKGGVPVATRSQVGALVARELRGAFVEGPVDVVMKPAASERSGLSGGVAMKEDDEVGSG